MTILETGRVCKKTSGMDAGKICVILAKADKNLYTIIGPNIKKSKANLHHLEPLPNKIKITKDADQTEITEHLKKEGLLL